MPYCWNDTPPVGPLHLYSLFAAQAVAEQLPAGLDDDTLNLVLVSVALGCRVALTAAGLPQDWTPQYRTALAAAQA